MKPILDDLEIWFQNNHIVALATIVHTQGSSPRETGAVMAVNEIGEVIGSISGGCVEAAVIEESLSVIADGKSRLLTYGLADEFGFDVGLTCGGIIQVFVQRLSWTDSQCLPLSTIFQAIRGSLQEPMVLCTIIQGEQVGQKLLINHYQQVGTFSNDALDQRVSQDAQILLGKRGTAIRSYTLQGEQQDRQVKVFFESFTSETKMIIFGAVDFARALSQLAKFLGYHVTICDARLALATS